MTEDEKNEPGCGLKTWLMIVTIASILVWIGLYIDATWHLGSTMSNWKISHLTFIPVLLISSWVSYFRKLLNLSISLSIALFTILIILLDFQGANIGYGLFDFLLWVSGSDLFF